MRNVLATISALASAAFATASPLTAQPAAVRTTPLGSPTQAGPEGYDLARPAVPVTAFRPSAWHVFLIAADRAEPVFDNAVARLAQVFESRYGVRAERFSAKSVPPPAARPATLAAISAAALARNIGPNDACLFYFTTHGESRGIVLAAERALAAPQTINAVIDAACGARPTILIVSACHSGIFIQPALARRHRIILTAARADRSSFGCSFREELTVYDRCFLASWDQAGTWQHLHRAVEVCVSAAETARRYRPRSHPQAFFGGQMRDFPLALQGTARRTGP